MGPFSSLRKKEVNSCCADLQINNPLKIDNDDDILEAFQSSGFVASDKLGNRQTFGTKLAPFYGNEPWCKNCQIHKALC